MRVVTLNSVPSQMGTKYRRAIEPTVDRLSTVQGVPNKSSKSTIMFLLNSCKSVKSYYMEGSFNEHSFYEFNKFLI